MAYGQWVKINIKPLNFACKIEDLELSWGKLYKDGDKDSEIKVNSVNDHIIQSKETYSICSCGRSDSASGTEGRFSLADGSTKIAKFHWDCPWASHDNTFSHEKVADEGYVVEVSDYNKSGGALGDVTITVVKV